MRREPSNKRLDLTVERMARDPERSPAGQSQRSAELGERMHQLLTRIAMAALLAMACASARSAQEQCATRVTLTGAEPMTWWLTDHTGFHGSAVVVVCRQDVGAIVASRAKLLGELEGVVRKEGYGMLLICHTAVRGPKDLEDARARARKSYAAMLQRFNRALGRPLVKRVECSFGSVEAFE
jgi:hypothetical protein